MPPSPPSPPFVVSADAVAALIQAGSEAQPAAATRAVPDSPNPSVIGRRLRSWARRLAGGLPGSHEPLPRLPEGGHAAAQRQQQQQAGGHAGRQLQQELLTPYGDSGMADPLALASGAFDDLAEVAGAVAYAEPAVPRLLQEGVLPAVPAVPAAGLSPAVPGLSPAAATVPLVDPAAAVIPPPVEPAPVTVIGGELPVPAVPDPAVLPPLVDVAAVPPNPSTEMGLDDVFLRWGWGWPPSHLLP